MKSPGSRAFIGLAIVIMLLLGILGYRQWQAHGRRTGRTNDAAGAKRVENSRKVAEAQSKRKERARKLKAMNVAQLAREMEVDSEKGREPFNSSSYRELVSRGETGATTLRPLLTSTDRSSMLGLLALRATDPEQYQSLAPQFRVNVLIDDFKRSKTFNAWGIPHLYWEDAAKALVSEGQSAVPALVALLGDRRDAPIWGSSGALVQRKYKYRVCDYAWAMLNEIGRKRVEIPIEPTERDKLIEKEQK